MKLKLRLALIACMTIGTNLSHAFNPTYAYNCAPKALEGNVAVVDQTVKSLVNSEEFQGADVFVSKINHILGQQKTAQRAVGYLNLVGVQSKEEIPAFIGATPEEREHYVQNLKNSSNLSTEQARKAIQGIADAFFNQSKR